VTRFRLKLKRKWRRGIRGRGGCGESKSEWYNG
jgi:hypothetical protein